MQKNKTTQKGSAIIAFIVIPVVISAIVMLVAKVSGPRDDLAGNGTVVIEQKAN